MPADAEGTPPAPVDDVVALRPKPARIRREGEPLTPEDLDLRRRVIAGRAEITDEDD